MNGTSDKRAPGARHVAPRPDSGRESQQRPRSAHAATRGGSFVIDPLNPLALTEGEARAVWDTLPGYLTEGLGDRKGGRP